MEKAWKIWIVGKTTWRHLRDSLGKQDLAQTQS